MIFIIDYKYNLYKIPKNKMKIIGENEYVMNNIYLMKTLTNFITKYT